MTAKLPANKETSQQNDHCQDVAVGRRRNLPRAVERRRLPGQAVLLDSIGCALGGYQQHDVKIALEVLDEIAGRGPATVIGTGKRIDAVSASLANALMIRCMDYNDIYWKQDPSHPSDIFPAAMARCERAKSDGRELIVGLVLGHEFEMRLCEAAFPGIRERGWHHATLTAFVSPFVAGRALASDGSRFSMRWESRPAATPLWARSPRASSR